MDQPHDTAAIHDPIGVGNCAAAVFIEINRNEHSTDRRAVVGNLLGRNHRNTKDAHRRVTQQRP